MRRKAAFIGTAVAILAAVAAIPMLAGAHSAQASAKTTTYDINTLAGKVASVNGTAGLQIRMSAFIEEEALPPETAPSTTINSTSLYPISSSLDGTSVQGPDVTVNQDTHGSAQNETAIAVDPNNPNRVVGSANDYVTRTWDCTVSGTPCSALGDGYSGTYYSNDGGKTWCCVATDVSHQGTLIPGVTHLSGGSYDAGGDPAVAFDSRGNVYYAGLGFDRYAPPNTVTVNQGTFDASGKLAWGAPTFINPTNSPAVFNDKEWIAADSNASSPYRDRVYVTWTRFAFNPANGNYVQSPIDFAYSTDGGKTFSTPTAISGNVLYDQGSRPVVGPDGTLYVFWDGAARLSTLDSTYMAKSTDGGVTWSKPVIVSQLGEISTPTDDSFRVNSFPAAAVAPDGTLYAAWSTEVHDGATSYGNSADFCDYGVTAGCHAAAVWSKSTDGGATWSAPKAILAVDGTLRQHVGYTSTSGVSPDGAMTDTFWPAVATTPLGKVYMSAYAADVESPWTPCKTWVTSAACSAFDAPVNNARLDYWVTDLTTSVTTKVTTQPINTQYQFRGFFIGDYTDIAAGSDGMFHALWTDTNNKQTITWWYGDEFVPGITTNQQDVVTASGNI